MFLGMCKMHQLEYGDVKTYIYDLQRNITQPHETSPNTTEFVKRVYHYDVTCR